MIQRRKLNKSVPVLAAALALVVFLSSLLLESMNVASRRSAAAAPPVPRAADPGWPPSLGPLASGVTGGLLDADDAEEGTEATERLLERARAFGEAGNAAGAYDFYAAVLAAHPRHDEALFGAGVFALVKGRAADAEEHLRAFMDQCPALALQGRKYLAWAQRCQGKLTAALENLKIATDEAPDDAVVRFQMACVYASMDEPSMAMANLEKAVALAGPGILTYTADPHLDPLRHVEAFETLTASAGAPGSAHATSPDEKHPVPESP